MTRIDVTVSLTNSHVTHTTDLFDLGAYERASVRFVPEPDTFSLGSRLDLANRQLGESQLVGHTRCQPTPGSAITATNSQAR